ncbi:MAG: collagen binding domain-containing protein [Wujia sp.]
MKRKTKNKSMYNPRHQNKAGIKVKVKTGILLLIGILTLILMPTNGYAHDTFEDMDEVSSNQDIPADNFSVTPTGTYITDILTGTGSYFSEIHNLLSYCGSGENNMAAYCIEPSKTAPSISTSYSEVGLSDTTSSSLSEKSGAAAMCMYGYGGESSINNYITDRPDPDPNMGGSYGTYVIDGTAYTGLLINGVFFPMTSTEAQAVTAAAIHKLNGSGISSVTGSLLNHGANNASVSSAFEHLYNLGYYAQINTTANGWEHTNTLLHDYTQPERTLVIQIQKNTGEWVNMPDTDQISFDWSPYIRGSKINLRIKYSAIKCESKLIHFEQMSDSGDNILCKHDSITQFADAPDKNDYYDYIRISEGTKNSIQATVTYGALKSESIQTLVLGVIDPSVGGFPACEGTAFTQTVRISFNAKDLLDGQTLDLDITIPEAAGHTPYYGDGDGTDGSYAAGRFFSSYGYQDIMVASPNMNISRYSTSVFIHNIQGSIELTKASSAPQITKDNSCYSLKGAVYGIYTSQKNASEGTDPITEITTDKSGYARTSSLPLGTYYIREIKAPKGYRLDSKIYTATIDSATMVHVDVTDEPCSDNTEIILYKRSDKGIPLEGAEFEVKYFDTTSEIKECLPVRIWYFCSDENGHVILDESHKTTGDDLYTDNDGHPVLPIGTITVRETKAPDGYIADETSRTIRIKDNQNPKSSYATENARIYENRMIKQAFQLTKYGESSDNAKNPLANAGFKACLLSDLIRDEVGNYIWDDTKTIILTYDGKSEMYTDENGYVCSIPLPYGTYVVRETTVPENYLPIKDFFVDITEASDTPQTMLYFTDPSFKAYLKILKQDVTTQEPIINNPASFRIWSYDTENYVEFSWTDHDGHHRTDTLQTDETGELTTPSPLYPGRYRIDESQSPKGYYSISCTGHDFEISNQIVYNIYQDDHGNDTDMGIFTFTINNTPLYGQIELYKTGEQLTDTDSETSPPELIPLGDVSFDIIAAENIYSMDGHKQLLYKKGSVIETLTTDSDGHAVSSSTLPLGKYKLHEYVPEGYMPIDDIVIDLSADCTPVEQSIDGHITKTILQTINIQNHPIIPESNPPEEETPLPEPDILTGDNTPVTPDTPLTGDNKPYGPIILLAFLTILSIISIILIINHKK